MKTAYRIKTLLLVAVIILLQTNSVGAMPQILYFDEYPSGNWETAKSGGSSFVSGGILTINSTGYNEFQLKHPFDAWHQKVNNSKGWVIETRLKVDASTKQGCSGGGGVLIWIHDHTNLIKIGFSTNEICIAYPSSFIFPMDTTDNFHVYRIESKLNQIKVYVDNVLRLNRTLSTNGAGTDVLDFGDGGGTGNSLSYWDYFWYDVDLPSNMLPIAPPYQPGNPFPINGSINQSINVILNWTGGNTTGVDTNGTAVTYTVYLDTNPNPTTQKWSGTSKSYSIKGLSNNTTYYWKVVADNGKTSTLGQVWSFTTPTITLPPTVTITTTPTTNPSNTPSQNIAPSQNDRKELPQLIGVTLLLLGLLFTALTTVKGDIKVEVKITEKSLKYVGAAGLMLIIIGAYVLLKSFELL